MFLLRLFGSKKLIALIAGLLATLVLPFVNKFLPTLDSTGLAASIGAILTMVVTYIAAQWHIDLSTNGATTTSALLKAVDAATAVPASPSLPSKVQAALQMAQLVVPPGPVRDAINAALAGAVSGVPGGVGRLT